jgi:gamma-glutamylcyclotransferase (GGCT)/AIG2-like uncharacterized protein YtfP
MADPTLLKLFVYGSLRSGFQHPAYGYISRYFQLCSPATVEGQLYDMGDYPAAVPAEAGMIIGELYECVRPEEFTYAMAQLDDYEGVCPENGEPALYRRDIAQVTLPDNSKATAWIYWYNGDIAEKPLIAHGDVLKYLQHKNPS